VETKKELFKKAQNNTLSLIEIAKLELKNSGIDKPKEIFNFLINNKDSNGEIKYLIYKFIINGLGTDKDIEKAKNYLNEAVKLKHPNAYFEYGLLLRYGMSGYKIDVRESEDFLRRAANSNIAGAQYELGVIFEEGIDVSKDLKEAFRWYQEAAKQKHIKASYRLGRFYNEGIKDGNFVLAQNLEEAIKLWTFSANSGDKEAIGDLAIAHLKLSLNLLSGLTDSKSKNLYEAINTIMDT
tara:strand:- start:234 stop:950 length:717 start_codon:yes stop_codon:yes gene_type:complete